MLEIVNGYVCYNCTDVDYAKKGIDPAHPNPDDPLNPKTKAKNEIAATGKTENAPAVILSGALAKSDLTNDDGAAQPADAENTNVSPAGSYARTAGAKLDISV